MILFLLKCVYVGSWYCSCDEKRTLEHLAMASEKCQHFSLYVKNIQIYLRAGTAVSLEETIVRRDRSD